MIGFQIDVEKTELFPQKSAFIIEYHQKINRFCFLIF